MTLEVNVGDMGADVEPSSKRTVFALINIEA